jgi:hypothetical protein
MAMKNQVNIGLIAVVTAVSALLLLVVIIGAHAGFLYLENRELQAKWEQYPNRALAEQRQAELLRISQYRLIDAARQAYGIPIEKAMAQVVQTRGDVKWAPLGP